MLLGSPAIQAVIKHAVLPAIMALTTIRDISGFRLGTRADNPPSNIPIDPMLANPHNAYVAMTSERA